MKYTHKTQADPNACLYVEVHRTEERSDYFHITLKARRREIDQYGNPDLRWPQSGYPFNLPYLAGLEVSCQGNNRTPDRDGYPLYAYKVAFNGQRDIEADEAEAMAVTLRRVDARMSKMAVDEGRIHTFGMFAMRVARALGVKAIVRNAKAAEAGYRQQVAMNPVEAGDWIDWQVEQWRTDMRKRYGLETPGKEVA